MSNTSPNVTNPSGFPAFERGQNSPGIGDAAMETKYPRVRASTPAQPFTTRPAAPPLDASVWPDSLSREEIAQARKLADKIRGLATAIQHESDRLAFLASCRQSVSGKNHMIAIDGELFRELTFGCFSPEARVARIDGAIAESQKKREDLEAARTTLRQELETRSQKIQAAIDACGIEGKLEEAILAAEQASMTLDAVQRAVRMLPVRFRRGYSFFELQGLAQNPSLPSQFRNERAKRTANGNGGAK